MKQVIIKQCKGDSCNNVVEWWNYCYECANKIMLDKNELEDIEIEEVDLDIKDIKIKQINL